MLAETAYNVFRTLDEEQVNRFIGMIRPQLEGKVIPLKSKKPGPVHWTSEEAKEYLLNLWDTQAQRRLDKQKKPGAGTPGLMII